MSSINLVVLSGRVERDPRISSAHYNPEERIARFSLVTTKSWTNKENVRENKKTWHRLLVKRENLVNLTEKYIKHGTHLIVTGELRLDTQGSQYPAEVLISEIRLGHKNDPISLSFESTPGMEFAQESLTQGTSTDNSLNMIVLSGYIGNDAEITTNPDSDLEVAKFSLAVNRIWTNKSTNERQERKAWYTIYAIRDFPRKQIINYARKGRWCIVVGEIGIRKVKPTDTETPSDTSKYITDINLRQLAGTPISLESQPDSQHDTTHTHNTFHVDSGQDEIPFDEII